MRRAGPRRPLSPLPTLVASLVLLLAPGGPPASRALAEGPPAAAVAPPVAAAAETLLFAPAEIGERGPLFALAQLAAALGGGLEPAAGGGGGWKLTVGSQEILFGAGSDALVVDREVIHLSASPEERVGELLVPLEFLRATFGTYGDYRFVWDAAGGRLTVERLGGRELEVAVDVVNLRGLSTVVLQFPVAPRYRLSEVPDGVEVELLGDRLAPSPPWRQDDPLVAGIDFQRDRIRIALKPGADADGYTLENPFRLVFDVHRGAPQAAVVPAMPVAPPREAEGVHTIVLDPGHGGVNTGAVGTSGVVEKELTLVLAQGLKAALERRLPVRVILTRGEDADLPLDTRTAIANQNKADLFVSLHLNSVAGSGSSAHGAETYFLSMQASDARAEQSAELENRGDGGGGGDGGGEEDPLHDLQLILWDLAQSHHLAESQRLAALIQEELNGALELANRGVKQAPFRVLMGAAMPAVLVELGFISNSEEERKLQDAGYRADLISALVRAIGRYKAEVDTRSARRDGGVGPGEPGAEPGTEPGAGG